MWGLFLLACVAGQECCCDCRSAEGQCGSSYEDFQAACGELERQSCTAQLACSWSSLAPRKSCSVERSVTRSLRRLQGLHSLLSGEVHGGLKIIEFGRIQNENRMNRYNIYV